VIYRQRSSSSFCPELEIIKERNRKRSFDSYSYSSNPGKLGVDCQKQEKEILILIGHSDLKKI
jgi:hypothetical protein